MVSLHRPVCCQLLITEADSRSSPPQCPRAGNHCDAFAVQIRQELLTRLQCAGQLIFVASYYDYVRLRNFLKEQEVQIAALSEYAAFKEAARARSLFLDGRLHVALLTERSHFYNRARVRGVKVRAYLLCD